MKFDRKELLDTLGSLRPAIADQGLIPELSHIWFNGKSVRAFNGGLGIRRKFKLDFPCGLPGKVLLDLLGTSSQDTAVLDKTGNNEVTIQLGKSKGTKLGIMPSDGAVWPFPTKFPKGDKAIELSASFVEALDKLKFVKLPKAALVVHNGILVVPNEGAKGCHLYATDSNTIARVEIKDVTLAEGRSQFLIDWRLADQIVKLFKSGVKLLVERDCIVVGGQRGILVGSNRLELPDTPDVPTFFSNAYVGKGQTDVPKGFATALERAAIVAGNDEPLVILDASKETLVVKGTYGLGFVNESLKLGKEVPAVKRAFLGPMITRGLGLVSKFVVSPTSLACSGEKGFSYVVATRETSADAKPKKKPKKSEE